MHDAACQLIGKIISAPKYKCTTASDISVLTFKATYAASCNDVQTCVVNLSGNLADAKLGKFNIGDHFRVRGGACVEEGMLMINSYKVVRLNKS